MKKILILILIIIFAVVGLGWSFSMPITIPTNGAIVSIVSGESMPEISKALADAHIVSNGGLFRLFFRIHHPTRTIKAGTYTFSGTVTLADVSRILISGTAKQEKTLRIIEGWRETQIADYLEAQSVGSKEEIQKAFRRDWSDRFAFLSKGQKLEGYLFPDTYRVFFDASAEEVVGKMLSNFDKKFPESLQGEARANKRSLREVVILASILEREVRSDHDRALVSDLFIRRIEARMALGADSTVNYATGKNSPQASYTDIAIDSPYNTYKHRGLPPGPISNPGISSLIAALRPERNPYWYFLTTKHQGEVIFSKTFEEHIRNKQKHLNDT